MGETLKLKKPSGATLESYLYANRKSDKLTEQVRANADDLMQRIGLLVPAYIDAGYKLHATKEGHSIVRGWDPDGDWLYAEGRAIGIYDPTGDLDDWLLEHQNILAMRGLWMEHPACTRGYCHLQTVPASDRAPRNGKRVFYP